MLLEAIRGIFERSPFVVSAEPRQVAAPAAAAHSEAALMRVELLSILLRVAGAAAVSYLALRYMSRFMDPNHEQREKAKKVAQRLLKSLGVKDSAKLQLSEHESQIASHLVQDSGVDWTHIGGHEDLKRELCERLIMPLKLAGHLKSELLAPPKGVLLYGPPGCGKTLLARAVARSAGARFLDLQASTLTNMWYGESNKLAGAVFSLAKKLQPCIIFIDEIDTFLRSRGAGEHEATAMMKAQFMTQWDGFGTDHACKVVVLGATNRPKDVDDAILRRMPVKLHVPLPDAEQRERILEVVLKSEPLSSDISLRSIAESSAGMDGSALREVCRLAALQRATDLVLGGNALEGHLSGERPICHEDLAKSLRKLQVGRGTVDRYSIDYLDLE